MDATQDTEDRVVEARLHDGTTIRCRALGSGPAVVLPVRTEPHDEANAEALRAWGGDPDYGPALAEGLADGYRVIAADYEAHRLTHPAPATLTPAQLTGDLLAIADAAGVDRFAYYGYSWLALAGLQLAARTRRLTALAMGGFPPMDGPYGPMLTVTTAAHAAATAQVAATAGVGVEQAEPSEAVTPGDWDNAQIQVDPAQTRQFVTLYEALQDFDDRAVSSALDMPRLCFAGAEDNIDYSPRWGGTRVRIAESLTEHRDELVAAGWEVELVPGLDHMSTMHADVVLPILRGWLGRALPLP